MYYSQQIVRRYCSITEQAEKIANTLTLQSCEVEELFERTIPHLIVIGKVTSVESHPNADKLVICKVDCGTQGSYQICTGATNIVVGHYVPVALPGAHLPAINLIIEPRTMRGEESNGMICSKEELGIAHDLGFHGIWTLQGEHSRTQPGYEDSITAGTFDDITDRDLGVPLADKYPWLENWIIDVENKTITHRPDLFGHFGLAFELQALFPDSILFKSMSKLQEKMKPGSIMQLLDHAIKHTLPVTVTSPAVNTYLTVSIGSVSVQQSDFYTKLQLIDCGLEPRNNRVDFSNLFMLTTGQPIHLFDKKKIDGTIHVRQAQPGEQFTDLFDKLHTLNETDIVIADDKKILALAGIVGSNNSGVDNDTTDLVVEIANFDPVVIRKTAMRLGLRTDAQIRFEKSINPLYSLGAFELLVDELNFAKKSLGSYEIAGIHAHINQSSDVHVTEQVEVDRQRIYKLLYGTDTFTEQFQQRCESILSLLGFTVQGDIVTVPVRRAPEDITKQEDVLEEVGRIIGFNDIDALDGSRPTQYIPLTNHIQTIRSVEDEMIMRFHAQQVETYPWLDKRWTNLGMSNQEITVPLKNPLNPDQSNLRDTMIRSMLEVIEKNAPFFEACTVFDTGKARNKSREHLEHDMFSVALYRKESTALNHPVRLAKEILERIIAIYGVQGKLEYVSTQNNFFHPKQQATILLNKVPIGSVQTIHPLLLQEVKIDDGATVTIGEIDCTQLRSMQQKRKKSNYKYESLTDQVIRRDLNFLVDSTMPYGIVTDALLKVKELSDVKLFDLYQGTNLPEGKKSCAVSIKIAGDGTLQTQQINEIMEKAIKTVESVGGTLRS